jgi:hypothetical protein
MNRQQPTITTTNRPNGRDDAAAFAGRVAGRRTARPTATSAFRRRARV